MTSGRVDPEFWSGRRVLVTGHTGFKGGWAVLWLRALGAEVTGLALPPDTWPALYHLGQVENACTSMTVDIRDLAALERAVVGARPQVILHMAAQTPAGPSYRDPVDTFTTNLMGTVNLLEAARSLPELEAVLVVTSDKVYENAGGADALRESDTLGGHGPYAASKAAAEIAVSSWRRSFLGSRVKLMTARSAHVLGGGDFGTDRIVPDIWRAVQKGEPLALRDPDVKLPWQHVLDYLAGYFLYLQAAVGGEPVPGALNFGPGVAGDGASPVELLEALQAALGAGAGWERAKDPSRGDLVRPVLDTSAAQGALGWHPRLATAGAIRLTADWYHAHAAGEDMADFTRGQIEEYG